MHSQTSCLLRCHPGKLSSCHLQAHIWGWFFFFPGEFFHLAIVPILGTEDSHMGTCGGALFFPPGPSSRHAFIYVGPCVLVGFHMKYPAAAATHEVRGQLLVAASSLKA